LEIPGSFVYSLAWTPSGNLLASGYANGTVSLHDPASGAEGASCRGHVEGGHSTEVIALAWSPDGTTLASGGIDYAIRLWDREGNALSVLRASTQARNDINGLAWSPDGLSLAAAGQAASVRIWRVDSESEQYTLHAINGAWMRGVAYSLSGDILATTGSDKGLALWDPSTGKRLMKLRGHEAPVWSVAWAPDGTMLATGSGHYQSSSGDTSVRIWGL
jgi:WD40 repeat protein